MISVAAMSKTLIKNSFLSMIVLMKWDQKIWSIGVSYCVEHSNIQRNSMYIQGHLMKVPMVE